MIPRPMVVQRARVEIVDEHAPARSAGKAHPGTAEVGFPAVERAERRAQRVADGTGCLAVAAEPVRSEEHTSELQSLMRISYAVFCLKKKKNETKTETQADTQTNTS